MASTKIGNPISNPVADAAQVQQQQMISVPQASAQSSLSNIKLITNSIPEETPDQFVSPSEPTIPYDVNVSLMSTSPEIILNSNFEPLWNNEGRLTEFGKLLNAKHHAVNVSIFRTMRTLFDSPEFQQIKTLAETNRQQIYDFVSNNENEITKLLWTVEELRKAFDPRYLQLQPKFESEYAVEYEPFKNLIEILSKVSYVNTTSANDPANNWTATKFWIQVCKEVEEILRRGAITKLLTNSSPLNYSIAYENNPFLIASAAGKKTVKFYWNQQQLVIPDDVIASSLVDKDFEDVRKYLQKSFSYNSFNSSLNNNNENYSNTIAKVAHLLCKEYLYSSTLHLNRTTGTNFVNKDVVRKNVNNTLVQDASQGELWDFIIGKHGVDVTDVVVGDPTTNSNETDASLISLAFDRRSVNFNENNQITSRIIEILTLEDRYITDDLGQRSQNENKSVITPGFSIFVEGIFDRVSFDNAVNLGDTNPLNFLISKVNLIKQKFNYLINASLFGRQPTSNNFEPSSDTNAETYQYSSEDSSYFQAYYRVIANLNSNFSDYSDPNKKLTKQVGGGIYGNITHQFADVFTHPIKLIRSIQSYILDGTPLLNRNALQRSTTTNTVFGNSFSSYSTTEINYLWGPEGSNDSSSQINVLKKIIKSENSPTDVSWLLISAAIDDPTLMTYLYMYAMLHTKSDKNQTNFEIQANLFEENYQTENGQSPNTYATYNVIEILSARILNRLKQKLPPSSTDNLGDNLVYTEDYIKQIPGSVGLDKDNFLKNCKILQKMGEYVSLSTSTSLNVNSQWLSNETTQTVGANFTFTARKSFHSNVSLGIFRLELFKLCCYIIHAANPEKFMSSISIEGISDNQNQYDQTTYFKVKRYRPFIQGSYSTKSFSSNEGPYTTVYEIDKILQDAEQLIEEQNIAVGQPVTTIYTWLSKFHDLLVSFRNSISFANNGPIIQFLSKVSQIVGDVNTARRALLKEQLLLLSSKFFDIKQRTDPSYVSSVRSSEIFVGNKLSENPDLELFLPLDDFSLISYPIISQYFKQSEYVNNSFNKKIISVGIPPRLMRRLQINASSIVGSTRRNSLACMKVYRKDAFNPLLVHKPKIFLFDLSRYPRRIATPYSTYNNSNTVNNRVPPGGINRQQLIKSIVQSKNSMLPESFAPLLSYAPFTSTELTSENENISSNNGLNLSDYYPFLSSSEKEKLNENHKMSLMFEYYLYWLSGIRFDEHKYNYLTTGWQAVQDLPFTVTSPNETFNRFFNDETLLQDINLLKKNLMMPKKFDRVFHIAIDPDDFEIDKPATQSLLGQNIDFENTFRNQIRTVSDPNNQTVKFFRRDTRLNDITFDSYWITIETYRENTNQAGA